MVNFPQKLRLITGLNGGLVTGVNPGLLVGGVQPALLGGGLGIQPTLIGGGLGIRPAVLGGGLLAQPQFGQMIPGVPYMVPPRGMMPFTPNLGAQQQQNGMPTNGRFPYFPGGPQSNAFGAQMGENQPQQQGSPGDAGNFNQQQGPALPGPLRRIKRSSSARKACTEKPSIDSQKLRLITGLNGGLVTGVNPGLLGVQPTLIGGGFGIQPSVLGGGLLAQPQFGQRSSSARKACTERPSIDSQKLKLITALNGGLLTGVNPGLLVGGVQPALLGGGLGIGGGLGFQPSVLGGGLLAQPQFGQMIPGVPYMVPPGMMPFTPNFGAQQQQNGMPTNGGFPYFPGGPQSNAFGAQMGPNQPQQQGSPGNAGNFNQQQGPALPGPLRRIKRSSSARKACTERPSIDSQIPTQITSTPTAAEDNTTPITA
ncbi:hypothetical protein SKAU_G00391920 [Synaphobranchus kaupii]|uniref:Uncharacterized protein n=1 Tax=Synaphobranchus kaupii TaxID=118154 RepID=A0A9Q1ICV5_SYNKA|nr:hypothetical protein SKAU_G00391920 [Synaphobranchus kaupii]